MIAKVPHKGRATNKSLLYTEVVHENRLQHVSRNLTRGHSTNKSLLYTGGCAENRLQDVSRNLTRGHSTNKSLLYTEVVQRIGCKMCQGTSQGDILQTRACSTQRLCRE
ncbi:hypothetical protein LSAT2_025128 [Lamellibrachia satsuma]|nr:hypothetical protein LSAT2_025128 [Lamellibrachia satsuma]